jgi:hypothetical protein
MGASIRDALWLEYRQGSILTPFTEIKTKHFQQKNKSLGLGVRGL